MARRRPAERDAAGRQRLLRALWREKLHIDREALDHSPAHVRSAFDGIWAPLDHLLDLLTPLPSGLLRLWLDGQGGHVLLANDGSRYTPGAQTWREREFLGLTTIALVDLLDAGNALWRPLLMMLDHLLGSDSAGECPWLSDGAGVTPALAELGARLSQSLSLGYGHEALDADDPHGYMAACWSLYLRDPRALNAIDPLTERRLRDTIMSEGWWRRTASDGPSN